MFEEKSISVVVPAYNEELLLPLTLNSIPSYVDQIVVINDCSTDETGVILEEYQKRDPRIRVLTHDVNKGLGQSLIDGYLLALGSDMDVIAVMAGDNQMSPDDLPNVLYPVAMGNADYVKGNRLFDIAVFDKMPRHRLIGNSILTLLTKFATGYWRVVDPQCGYTAISKEALKKIPIDEMIKGYGYNAHILNMLNLSNCIVKDVDVAPVYGEEKSTIKLGNYIVSVSALLIKLFIKRMVSKYLFREFHPLVFLYMFSAFNALMVAFPLLIRVTYMRVYEGYLPQTSLILFTFSFTMAFWGLFMAMWMDMEDNKRLVG